MEEEEDVPSFTLRKYVVEHMQTSVGGTKNHSNTQVGVFGEANKQVFVLYYQPIATQLETVYQIYPGNVEKTFYTLPHECALYAFRGVSKQGTSLMQIIFLGHTDSPDQYLYFELPADTKAIAVICAKTYTEAEQLLLSSTKTFTK